MTFDFAQRALFSHDGNHRYYLSRDLAGDAPPLTFVMLNPSTANSTADDSTIGFCRRLAAHNGARGIRVVNLYSRKATNAQDLYPLSPSERLTSRGRNVIKTALLEAERPVFAWGGRHPELFPSDDRLRELREWCRGEPLCLGMTLKGQPHHPQYKRADRALVPFGGGT